ncbi:hypothetical protein A4R43_12200 [Amycolatopsis albispora]|uniref:Uncharacterized protein n=1 Tax=Amycolatopsis albispora TaxID=1804986 RepID=A0A344L592_9PSEU|nr:hypothetical protein A4R43_12200 [Amycolatopsis albispora]
MEDGDDASDDTADQDEKPSLPLDDAEMTGPSVDGPAGILGGLADEWQRTSGDASSARDEGEGGARAAGESWQDDNQRPQQERTGRTLDETKGVEESARAMEDQVRRSGEQIDAALKAIEASDRDAGSVGLLEPLLGAGERDVVTSRTDAMAAEERERIETETAQRIRNDPGWEQIAPAATAPAPPPAPPADDAARADDPSDGSKGIYADLSVSTPLGPFGGELALMFDDKGFSLTGTPHGGLPVGSKPDPIPGISASVGFKESSAATDQLGGTAVALGASGFLGPGIEVGGSVDTNGQNFSDNIGVGVGLGAGIDVQLENEALLYHARWEDVPQLVADIGTNVYEWMADVGRRMQEGGVC